MHGFTQVTPTVRRAAGVSGTFLGAEDECFGVLSMDRSTVEVYETGESPLPSQPLCTASMLSGHALALFQGPKLAAPRCVFIIC